MARGKVLLISAVGCPPPYYGNRTRTRDLLVRIRDLGYEVHFAGICMHEEERASTRPFVDEWVWDFASPSQPPVGFNLVKKAVERRLIVLTSRARSAPILFHQDWLAEARQIQRQRHYERVIVSYACYSKFFLAFPEALKILDTHDVFTNRREKLQSEGISGYWMSLSRSDETAALRRANRIIAIQEEEAAYFAALPDVGPVYTIGWDAEPLPPVSISGNGLIGYIGSENELNLRSIEWFLANIWPSVRRQCPKTRMVVGGNICKRLGDFPKVERRGAIADLHYFYNELDLVLNPMITGTGLKIKTLEAIVHNKCVVTSSAGAHGLKPFVGRGIIQCDTPDDYVSALVFLLNNPKELARMSADAAAVLQEVRTANRDNLAAVLA